MLKEAKMTKNVLIVDDAVAIVKGLKYSLEQDEYSVVTAYDGEEALAKFRETNPDIIILDIMLPKIDGLEVCRTIRKTSIVPIIMLTAKDDDNSKITGLEIGADDYMTKPFNVMELKARIKAILRRYLSENRMQESSLLQIDNIEINTLGRKIKINDNEINLTAKEFDLLLLLALNKGKAYSREELLEIIWGYEYFGDVRTVDVHVRRLREKIEEVPSKPRYIMTKWGTGYYYNSQDN